jgi:hypothetical protein
LVPATISIGTSAFVGLAVTSHNTVNTQVNALQQGFDGTADFRIWSRITQPFTGVTPALGHVGGVFFGPGEDAYVRLALVGTASAGNALQLGVEIGGTLTEAARINLPLGMSNLDVLLIGGPATHTVAAYYT